MPANVRCAIAQVAGMARSYTASVEVVQGFAAPSSAAERVFE